MDELPLTGLWDQALTGNQQRERSKWRPKKTRHSPNLLEGVHQHSLDVDLDQKVLHYSPRFRLNSQFTFATINLQFPSFLKCFQNSELSEKRPLFTGFFQFFHFKWPFKDQVQTVFLMRGPTRSTSGVQSSVLRMWGFDESVALTKVWLCWKCGCDESVALMRVRRWWKWGVDESEVLMKVWLWWKWSLEESEERKRRKDKIDPDPDAWW